MMVKKQEKKSPELFFAEYLEKLCIPARGLFHITGQCNLKCKHFYLKSRWNDDHVEMDAIMRIVHEAKNSGCLFVTLAGGEPLIHPEFQNIYRKLFDSGLKITVATNGTSITPEIANLFLDKPPFNMKISLYGIDESSFSAVRTTDIPFENFTSALDLLHERNIPFTLVAMMLSLNKKPVADIEAFAGKWKAPVEFHTSVTAGIDGDLSPLKYRLSADDVRPYYKANGRNYNTLYHISRRPRGSKWTDDGLHNCSCGRTSFFVDSFLKLHPCSLSSFEGVDLKEIDFKQGWMNIRARLSDWIGPTALHKKYQNLTMCPPFIRLQGNDFDIDYHLEISELQNRSEEAFINNQDRSAYSGIELSNERFSTNVFLAQISGFITKCACNNDDANPYNVE